MKKAVLLFISQSLCAFAQNTPVYWLPPICVYPHGVPASCPGNQVSPILPSTANAPSPPGISTGFVQPYGTGGPLTLPVGGQTLPTGSGLFPGMPATGVLSGGPAIGQQPVNLLVPDQTGLNPVTTRSASQNPIPPPARLPGAHPWFALAPVDQRALSLVISRNTAFSNLVYRVSEQGQSISLSDVQQATSLWIEGRMRESTGLPRALEALLLTDSGVVRVLPSSQWQLYVGMRSAPNSPIGQAVRYAANETLFAESQMHPIISAASETEREQLESIFNELHLLNRILDHSFTRSDLPANQILEVGRSTRSQIFAFMSGVGHRLPSEMAGLAVAAVAAAMPLPAVVTMGGLAAGVMVRDMMTGALRARILAFRDRITGPDSEDRARALGEATVAVAACLVGGANANSIGEMISRRVGARMNIVASAAEMTVLRTTGQEILNDVLRELHLPLRELPEAIFHIRISTPYGEATQELSREALLARTRAEFGAPLYRRGIRSRNHTGQNAQFWALEHPSTPGFTQRHSLPAENVGTPDFIETATLRPNSDFITRRVAPLEGSPGGAIEVVVPENGVTTAGHSSLKNIKVQ